jgi:hypothetical protein
VLGFGDDPALPTPARACSISTTRTWKSAPEAPSGARSWLLVRLAPALRSRLACCAGPLRLVSSEPRVFILNVSLLRTEDSTPVEPVLAVAWLGSRRVPITGIAVLKRGSCTEGSAEAPGGGSWVMLDVTKKEAHHIPTGA